MKLPTVPEHLRYLRFINLRPTTIYQRGRVLHRLADHAGCEPIKAEPGAVYGFLERQRDPATRACELSHLRGFYAWATMIGHHYADPTAEIKRPRTPRRLPRPMPDADVWRALRESDGELRQMLHLAAYAGLRACEIGPIRGEHLTDGRVLVEEGKGGDMGSVPMSPILAKALSGSPRNGYLFPYGGLTAYTPAHAVSHTCNSFLHGLGITHTLHTLRHWFGSKVYIASGRDLRATQELMRHRSPVSTAGYTFIDPGDLGEIVSLLPTG